MNENRGFITYALVAMVFQAILTFNVEASTHATDIIFSTKYIIVDIDNRHISAQLDLKKNSKGFLKQKTKSSIKWKRAANGVIIKPNQPMILSRFETAPNSIIRVELTQLQLIHLNDKLYQSVRHYNAIDENSNEIIEAFTERSNVAMLEKQKLKRWDLDLTGKKWTIDGIELLTYSEQPYFSDVASASAHFISKKHGEFIFFNGDKAPFKWHLKDNKLIIKTHINGKKQKYTFWKIDKVGNVGIEFVADVKNSNNTQLHTRRGMFIEQQETVFNLDAIVGSWHLGAHQYDHYADNITIPNIVHPGSRWELTDDGTFLRFKLTHPEQGSVIDCPDDTCYLACKFTHRLIAREGNTLYMENGVVSEFEPMSPLRLNNASVGVVEFNPQHGIEQFSHSWLDFSTLTFNDGKDYKKLRFMVQQQPDGVTNYTVRSFSDNSILAHYSIVNDVLSIIADKITSHYKVLSFSRTQLTACKYGDDKICSEGEIIKIDLHNGLFN